MTATVGTPTRMRNARRVGFAAWSALLVLQFAWHWWLWPSPFLPPGLALAIVVVPLLLPLLALRRPQRALLWAGMVALLYFCQGVSQAWLAPEQRLLAFVEIALSVVLIGACGVRAPKQKPTTAR
ncbi:MAG TPA: DUF2069 domain-containing protein [Rhodanobacteraceae bacterium]|nr:DUF2069 domain-containing protein [Rhodanobacteraceae bacterium]